MSAPGPDALSALERKYRTLAALRAAGAPSDTPAARARLRALAREFPGALRELDSLPTDEILRRADALAEAARGGEVAPWMTWLDGYHALMRIALALRAGRDPGVAVDPAFAAAVAAPPGGRLMAAVFDRLAQEHGIPRKRIRDALFPARASQRHYR